MKKVKPHTRKTHREVLDALRQTIVTGGLRPGSRLPTHIELKKQFATTAATTQRALDGLASEGFVLARGRAGTFVVDRPPHRYRFGLAFPADPAVSGQWGTMFQAIDAEARRINASGAQEIKIYYGVHAASAPGRLALLDDVKSNRIAGLLYASRFDAELLAELQAAPRRIALAELSFSPNAGVIHVRTGTYISKVLDYLKSRGRARVGLILSSLHGSVEKAWKSLLDERGLQYDPYWAFTVSPSHPDPARNAAYLMLRQPRNARPDALIITDDYLVEMATAGVRDSGAHAPEDVEVVAHCNFPLPPASHVPVTRIGYDMPLMLNDVLKVLDEKAAGRAAKVSEVLVPALFENETRHAAPIHLAARPPATDSASPLQPSFTFG